MAGTSGEGRGGAIRAGRLSVRFALAMAALLLFGYTARHWWEGRTQHDAAVARDLTEAETAAGAAAGKIDERLRSFEPAAQEIAKTLEARDDDPDDATLDRLFVAALAAHPEIFEIGVAWSEGASSTGERWRAPHRRRGTGPDDTGERFRLEEKYEYAGVDWFKATVAAGRARWGEPYRGKASARYVVGYNVPFRRRGAGAIIGVARFNFTVETLRDIVNGVAVGQHGYGFLVAQDGRYLVDPNDEYVRRETNLRDVAARFGDAGRLRIAEAAQALHAGRAPSVSGLTGQETWIVSSPVPRARWSLGLVFIAAEIGPPPVQVRRQAIQTGLLVTTGLLLLLLAAVPARLPPRHRAWWFVGVVSATLIEAIAFIWLIVVSHPDLDGEQAFHVYNARSLDGYLERGARRVPIGLLVQTVSFGSATQLQITGQIWQRRIGPCPAPLDATLRPEILLPDAENAQYRELRCVPEDNGGGRSHRLFWWFTVALRTVPSHADKYPFDVEPVRVRFWPRVPEENAVVVPDVEGFDVLSPSARPGLSRQLIVSGWQQSSSYFTFERSADAASIAGPRQPELRFNMLLRRSLLDPFISALLPIAVVSVLLFLLLLVCTKEKNKIAATGFKATDILRAVISLLFSVIVAQIGLRNKITASGLVYVEYFYFALYTAILGVAMNCLMFTMNDKGLAQRADNLVAKVAFWPALLGTFFVVTLLVLY